MSAYLRRFPRGFLARSSAIIISGGTAAFVAFETLQGNERFYREVLMPVGFKVLDPESAHKWTIRLLKRGLIPSSSEMRKEYPELRTQVLGMKFDNPIGIAAGFDKDAEVPNELRKMGLGFVEVGTVTPLPQDGNPCPRVFRLADDSAVINRYGFNSRGHGAFRSNLAAAAKENVGSGGRTAPLGVNVGKNKESAAPELDYSVGASLLGHFADYLTLNLSSPNTPGLRSLQHGAQLRNILKTVADAVKLLPGTSPKIFLKVAPDMSHKEREAVVRIIEEKQFKVDGIIVSNTTVQRPPTLQSVHKDEAGGLSGAPLKDIATEAIRDFYVLTKGKMPIIGCGGISNGEDAYEKVKAGASLLQIYSAIVYQGFPVVGRIKRELAAALRRDGYQRLEEAVGVDSRK